MLHMQAQIKYDWYKATVKGQGYPRETHVSNRNSPGMI